MDGLFRSPGKYTRILEWNALKLIISILLCAMSGMNFRLLPASKTRKTYNGGNATDSEHQSQKFHASQTLHEPVEPVDTMWQSDHVENITDFFLYHVRKAGGTSLRWWLREVAQKRQERHRGTPIMFDSKTNVIEGFSLSASHLSLKSPSTYTVTSIRDPVSRVLSSYDYEGRWGGTRFAPIPPWPDLEDIARLETSLDDWIDKVGHGSPACRKQGTRLWKCVSNCFVKWFSGWDCKKGNVTTEDLKLALHVIGQFDLVICSAKLGNASYIEEFQETIRRALQIPTISSYKHRLPFRAKETNLAKEKYPYRISLHSLARLRELNDLDYLFYEKVSEEWC